MVLRELMGPTKLLYKFAPGTRNDDTFRAPLTIRVCEIIAQKTGKKAVQDLGLLGCCAVTNVIDPKPEVWVDFRFKYATYPENTGFTGRVTYHPKPELKALKNYLYFGELEDNISVVTRTLPEYNKKGEVIKETKNVAILRLHVNPALCVAVMADHNVLDPDFMVRYGVTEHGNAYMTEYVDPELVDKYMAIEFALTVKADSREDGADNSGLRFNPEDAVRAMEEGCKNLIPRRTNSVVLMNAAQNAIKDKKRKKNKDRDMVEHLERDRELENERRLEKEKSRSSKYGW